MKAAVKGLGGRRGRIGFLGKSQSASGAEGAWTTLPLIPRSQNVRMHRITRVVVWFGIVLVCAAFHRWRGILSTHLPPAHLTTHYPHMHACSIIGRSSHPAFSVLCFLTGGKKHDLCIKG
jgi:hypothetical protein